MGGMRGTEFPQRRLVRALCEYIKQDTVDRIKQNIEQLVPRLPSSDGEDEPDALCTQTSHGLVIISALSIVYLFHLDILIKGYEIQSVQTDNLDSYSNQDG